MNVPKNKYSNKSPDALLNGFLIGYKENRKETILFFKDMTQEGTTYNLRFTYLNN